MTVEQMIKNLRLSVHVQDSGSTELDPKYLAMTDDELRSFLDLCLLRNFPDVPALELAPSDSIYGLILLAKKELYYTLAVIEAPLYDMNADNSNSLSRSQRFEHYMKLIGQADKEYTDWLENGGIDGGIGTVTTYNVVVANRYSTRYNYENAPTPKVTLYTGTITSDAIEVQWTVKNIGRFKHYKVYASEESIVDLFNPNQVISPDSKEIFSTDDIHKTKCRVTGLSPDTVYHIAVEAASLTGVKGYFEITVQTYSEDSEDESYDTNQGGDS